MSLGAELVFVVGVILAFVFYNAGLAFIAYRIGKRAGYDEGSNEAVPMYGQCGTCGESFEGGTVADAITRVKEHVCPERPE
jgi:hypothetical protein